MRGVCWIAPNAAAYAAAIITVVTIVVRANAGVEQLREARALQRAGRFFSRQVGDSGRNGRIRISGIAGMTPDISV